MEGEDESTELWLHPNFAARAWIVRTNAVAPDAQNRATKKQAN